jgi:DNA (cytosine-5)-methyltransferase 1
MTRRRSPGHRGSERVSALSLFCGVGGLDLGFLRAGVRILNAYDCDPYACQTYEAHFGFAPVCTDIGLLGAGDLRRSDIVLAGPPCQGFSSIGARKPKDPRNSLMIKAASLIGALRPKAFIIENVAGIQWHAGGRFLRRTLRRLEESGLRFAVVPIECSRLGVAQHRRRILVVGGRGRYGDLVLRRVQDELSRPCDEVTVRDVLSSMPRLGGLPNHSMRRDHPEWYANVIHHIGPGQKLCDTRLGESSVHSWDIPDVFGRITAREKHLLVTIAKTRRWRTGRRYRSIGDGRAVSYGQIAKHLGTTIVVVRRLAARPLALGFLTELGGDYIDLARKFNGRFKRLPLDSPAPAVLKDFGSPRNMLHPTADRALTVRECARLQGFPDDFHFIGGSGQQYQLVANAFPPPVAERLARAVAGAICD